ncbi:MAG: hypothetical protein JNL97_02150, partial [Verrucomicrobiales bacterium]|nr:hypothetical protein [Verrucomicrobiales bacterium]
AALVFQSAVPESMLTPEGQKLIDNTIAWLSGGKPGKVLFSPSAAGEGDVFISQRVTSNGYTVADDDTSAALPDPSTIAVAVSTSGGVPATRFTRYAAPVLTYNGPNHDDMLTSSIGAGNSIFDPGEVSIVDTSHPIAAGLPPKFQLVNGEIGLDTVGTTLPEAAKVIATYKFANPDTGQEETRPLLVVIEKGDGLLGGAFKGYEGAGFWAGADMNEPTVTPDCCATVEDPRQLTLKSVNVAGKRDLRITVALAATDIDFENTDFLRIMIDPDGNGPAEFSQLVNFTTPTANDKYFADGEGKNRLSTTFRDVTYKIPDGATDLVVRFDSTSTFFNEIVGFDNIRIHSGDLPPSGPVGQPAELGQTVNGFQDDFTGATRNPDWKVRGPGGDYYAQGDGVLRVSARAGDPNHLLYEAAGYHTNVQEVLARIRITAFGNNDAARAGIGVGIATNNSQGINLHFRNFLQDAIPGRQFKLLDDARAWGPPGLKTDWETNQWFWLRLRQAPNAGGGTDDVFAKAWLADGKTAEPTDWQLKWDYNPTRTIRNGYAGITACSIDGVGTFEVDYILIKAEGLPSIKVAFDPVGPAPTTPRFTQFQRGNNNALTLQWIGAGILQQANDGAGPWTDVTGAVTPRTITPSAANPNKLYRIRP